MTGSMEWCCAVLEHHAQKAGHRGIGIFADVLPGSIQSFFLQFRAVDKEESIHVDTRGKPVSLVVQTGILFCPWCGTSLQKFYGTRIVSLLKPGVRLAAEEIDEKQGRR